MERLTTLSDTDSFDIYFWRRQGYQARFAAAWKTIEEFYKMRSINGYKSRLQKNFEIIYKNRKKTKRPQDKLDLKRI